MYFTANGRALPCCIAPFAQRGYENYTLGDASQESLREIWNGPAYQDFPRRAAVRRAARAARLRPAMEPVTPGVAAVIPCLDEEAAIGQVVRRWARRADRVMVAMADRGTHAEAPRRGARGGRGERRGYGRASRRHPPLRPDAGVVLFLDGDGSDPPDASPTWSARSWPAERLSCTARASARPRSRRLSPQQVRGGPRAQCCCASTARRFTDHVALPRIRRDALVRWGCAKPTAGTSRC
jgi:hypothetical protein